MNILMVAAENGAIAGAKVGGIADVIHDVPLALAAQGHNTAVVIPDYLEFYFPPALMRTGKRTILKLILEWF